MQDTEEREVRKNRREDKTKQVKYGKKSTQNYQKIIDQRKRKSGKAEKE